MAKHLTKLLGAATSLLLLYTLTETFPQLGSMMQLAAESTLSFPYTPAALAALIVTAALTALWRAQAATAWGYFYAPQKRVEISKNDLRKADITLVLMSKEGFFEDILSKTLGELNLTSAQPPLWVKISADTISKSYLLARVKTLYGIGVLGHRQVVTEFLDILSRRLNEYAGEGIVSIVRSEPQMWEWVKSAAQVKDPRLLPPNLRLKEEGLLSWLWRLVIVGALSALVIYLVIKILSKRIDAEKARQIASRHLEEVHGISPEPKAVLEGKEVFIVEFKSHEVHVDKRSGKVVRVVGL